MEIQKHTMTCFDNLKNQAKLDLRSSNITDLLIELTSLSYNYLTKYCKRISLSSSIPNKKYSCFLADSGKISRPLNYELYNYDIFNNVILSNFKEDKLENIDLSLLEKLLYFIGLTFPAFIDIVKSNDKKTPGTYFEYFIGHLVARKFGTNPRKQLEIPVSSDEEPKFLPTDLIFDIPSESYGLHVPVKSTTRERVIQVWAHQRILDSVYGTSRFKGILVVASETKLGTQRRDVVEICLPSQWRIYQLHIAQLKRIYYLDPPEVYLRLNNQFPYINVKSFARFFNEDINSF